MTAGFDDLRDLSQEIVLDRGRKPRHGKRLDDFDAAAKGDNPMCGDRVEVWVKYAPGGAIARALDAVHGAAAPTRDELMDADRRARAVVEAAA